MALVRLASFKAIVDYNSTRFDVSYATLASAGFRSTCNGAVVQCDGCGQLYDLEVFIPDGFMRNPNQSFFHAYNCPFISSGDYNETSHNNCTLDDNIYERTDSANHNTNNNNDALDIVTSTDGQHQQRDGVMEQHQKYRPNCQYLQALGRQNAEITRIDSTSEVINVVTNMNIKLNVVQKENYELKKRLLCKVCNMEMVKAVFLPCGELYACASCSKLLTHCPSCCNQILATVTAFL